MLRKRGVRGEQPLELSVGILPPEAAGDPRSDPEEEALLGDTIGLALYVVMGSLQPGPRPDPPGHAGDRRRGHGYRH